jgi:shikimate kinase
MRVILIGFMGSGKTTFGRKLATKLDLPFIDSDLEIEMNENKSINQLFTEYGEDGFRKMETDFIKNLALSDDEFVLSTGGGLPCFNNNMETLNSIGLTLYIKLSPKALVKRLENGKNERPLLKNKSEDEMLQYIEETLEKRSPFYQKAKIIFPGIDAKKASAIDLLIEEIHSK